MYGESEEDYKKRKEQKIQGLAPHMIVVDDIGEPPELPAFLADIPDPPPGHEMYCDRDTFIPTSGVHNPLTLLTHFRIEAELAYIQSKKELGEDHLNTLKLNDILNQFEKFADGCSTINPSFDIVLAYMKEEG